ncbi:helix-turn-helix domain-containing protein [Ralstonia pseudosolanacearum]|uniref:XRE family transcriptional regulator n=1 Tax=Ralstonia pseudosolanacearum TaxID=1310165 RepID=UPI0020063BD1|nr:S24 family peptidase [Ralstonia pseudosolanacearum]MCK4121368.1 helix-turn-helix domain-containing protein [Ralstonia pseudosolanacearum]
MKTSIKHCLLKIKHCCGVESNDVIRRMKTTTDTAALAHRISQAIDEAKLTAAEIAAECGVTPQAVNGWKRTGRIGKGHLPKLAELTGKSLEWFLGSDEQPKAPTAGSKGFPARPITVYESLDELPPESTVLIAHVDVVLSAGNGRETWHVEQKEPLPFQADYIRRLDASPKNLVAVKVRGDSMETRLFNDDTVVVDKADKRIPASGGVFALVYSGEMLVKRLFKLPDGSIDVVSDNPKYKSLVVSPEQLEHIDIVGRVKYRSGMGDF